MTLKNGFVFTDTHFVQKDMIVTKKQDTHCTPEIDATNHYIIPGFTDIQVNGGGGVFFNGDPSVKTLATMVAAHQQFGTTQILPTFITDETDRMVTALQAAKQAAGTVPGIAGIHLEGPFLNPEKKGTHQSRFIRPLTEQDVQLILENRPDITLMTLAPEMIENFNLIRQLIDNKVKISIGHSLCPANTLETALAEGIDCLTHLYNAMDKQGDLITAAHTQKDLWFSMIVDGEHVPYGMVKETYDKSKVAGSHMMLASDAMAFPGSDITEIHHHGLRIYLNDQNVPVSDGARLAGSNLTQLQGLQNCVRHCGIPLEEAVQMASTHPANYLGLPPRGWVMLDKDLNLVDSAAA